MKTKEFKFKRNMLNETYVEVPLSTVFDLVQIVALCLFVSYKLGECK